MNARVKLLKLKPPRTKCNQLKIAQSKHLISLCLASLALYLWVEHSHAKRVSNDKIASTSLPLLEAADSPLGQLKSHALAETSSRPPKEDPDTSGPAKTSASPNWPHCMLGNDSFQIGDKWNPHLHPFGIQFCVLCECVFRQRKSCYELKVTCRRLHSECPGPTDLCPDGTKPVTKAGQCCKSCPNRSNQASNSNTTTTTTEPISPTDQAVSQLNPAGSHESGPASEQAPTSIATRSFTRQHRTSYKNDRLKEYKSITKVLPACNRRDSSGERLIHSSSSTSTISSPSKAAKLNKFILSPPGNNATNDGSPALANKQVTPRLATSMLNSSSSPEALASLREYNRQQSKNLHLLGADAAKEEISNSDAPENTANDNLQQPQPVLGQLFSYLINLMTRRGLTNYLDSSCPSCKH